MMFSDIHLNRENYFGIEKRLPFKAFWDNGGQCYLDLKVIDGKIIALCGQLINYTNTSIVNAAEGVYRSIIDYLISNNILVVRTKFSFTNIFSPNEAKYKEIEKEINNFLYENMNWYLFFNNDITLDSHTGNDLILHVRTNPDNGSVQFLETYQSWETLQQKHPNITFSYDKNDLILTK
ncbi:TPA: hypothetical protein ACFP4N_001455 [Neisseria subflava]|jgi:hypothetical protein